jgi:exonuclease III
MCEQTQELNICMFNCNGLNGKLELINNFIYNNKVNLLILQETWTRLAQPIAKNVIFHLSKYKDGYINGGRRANGGIQVI